MQLKLFRHLWGVDLPWEEAFPRIKAAGYIGIETGLPSPADESRFTELREAHGLAWICGAHTLGVTVDDHLDQLRRTTERAKRLGARFVSAQAGRDAFTFDEATAFLNESLRIERTKDIPISHETHRSRPFYNPWTTARLLQECPTLKLTCDLSHWVCVTERLLEDCLPIIQRTAKQAYHIHARVGFAEGPQVPDPRVTEYLPEVEAHERWWDLMWDSQQQRGFTESTMCPEFGPPRYLHTMPGTGMPLANLWDVCEWQAARQRERFQRRSR
ncbi:MAG: sugar phosphate isomerase/epimerase family protein [Tepidisphaeraceae bacterium]